MIYFVPTRKTTQEDIPVDMVSKVTRGMGKGELHTDLDRFDIPRGMQGQVVAELRTLKEITEITESNRGDGWITMRGSYGSLTGEKLNAAMDRTVARITRIAQKAAKRAAAHSTS